MVPNSGSTRSPGELGFVAERFEDTRELYNLPEIELPLDPVLEPQVDPIPAQRPSLDNILEHGLLQRLDLDQRLLKTASESIEMIAR
jgi:hypothetical protein